MFDLDWVSLGPYLAAAIVFGYLLGSIPFGLIFSWLAGAGDVRKIGSGNIGATNVLRTGNRWAAAATLLCDGGKGAVAVLLARHFENDQVAVFAGLGAFLGHLFPLWLGFKGGKGMATFLGVTLALFWPVGLLAMSALIAAVLTPLYMALFHHPLFAMLELVLVLLIFAMHRENIRRILNGQEPKIGETKKA